MTVRANGQPNGMTLLLFLLAPSLPRGKRAQKAEIKAHVDKAIKQGVGSLALLSCSHTETLAYRNRLYVRKRI